MISNWNKNWKFWEEGNAFALVWNVPEDAKEVNLPHDAMMERPVNPDSKNGTNTGFRDGAVYTYVKTLEVSKEDLKKQLFLYFEGVYMNAFVYVNQQLAGKNPNGYTGFYVPLSPYLKEGENEIRVQARCGAMGNSRWYSGGGIYRDVWLLEKEDVYFMPQETFVITEDASEDMAVLRVVSKVKNVSSRKQQLLLSYEIKDPKGQTVNVGKERLALFGGSEKKVEHRTTMENPLLWDAENPNRYTLQITAEIESEEKNARNQETVFQEVDREEQCFGIRYMTLDAKRGLRINGKSVKLRGGCIHHDSGVIGAATFEEAEYRRVAILKEAGFNAIRMSHHPAADALLRACDALGMYVMDETFDMWNRYKSDYDYSLYFSEWWEKDVESMVKKDRVHPSVILYSIGNEIPEIGTDQGSDTAYALSQKVHELDPAGYTLAGINGVFAAGDCIDRIVGDIMAQDAASGNHEAQSDTEVDASEKNGNVNDFMTVMDTHMGDIVTHPLVSEKLDFACGATDIAGYNYMTARYALDAKENPDRIMVGSETYPPEIPRNWKEVNTYPQVIGDFTWTAWDYIGEAGIGIPGYHFGEGGFTAQFPAQLAYIGDMDITGYRRPASYFREIVFGLRKDPYITVQDPHHYGEHLMKTPWMISDSVSTWNWKGCEEKPVIIEVYAPGDEVELIVNGTSLGKKDAGEKAGYITCFETTYTPGEVEAVSYENGKEIGRMKLASAGEYAKLSLIDTVTEEHMEKRYRELSGKDAELIYVPFALTDEKGQVVTDADEEVAAKVSGAAELLGIGSGDPRTDYDYKSGKTATWNGRGLAVLRRMGEGTVSVELTSESGKTVQSEFKLWF